MDPERPNALVPGMREEMRSHHQFALAGVGAALLSNYWVLESLLARRIDPSDSWISDLGARSEVLGWRFQLLAIVAGLAIAAFALLLLRRLGALSPTIRRGVLALLATGLLAAIGGVPLSCAEGLEASCSLEYDPFDLIHATANLAEIATTALAFGAIGIGLSRLAPQRRGGRLTLAIGTLWILLTALTGGSYLSTDLDSVKGIVQRADQLLFGAWLILLGLWAPTWRSMA
ncbi:MAG: DUF998 domain-containing protein [Solirubrobacterales bacterium]